MSIEWLSDIIQARVYPHFEDAKKTVCSTSTAYKELNNLDLPKDFTGKEVVNLSITAMESSYSAADKIKGFCEWVGSNFTEGDSESFKKVLSDFETTETGLIKSRIGAVVYQQTGKMPTDQEIDSIITNQTDSPYIPTHGMTAEELAAFMEKNNNINNARSQVVDYVGGAAKWFLKTGATVSAGFVSGFVGFFGDTIGGVATFGASILETVCPQYCTGLTEGTSNFWDLGRTLGPNDGSMWY